MSTKKQTETTDLDDDKTELDRILFKGHRNILGLHRNTMEITKASEISMRADCVIGVEASKSCSDLNQELKHWILSGGWLEFEIRTDRDSFVFTGRGSSRLELTHDRELVLRKSDYASPRTAAVNCSHSARDIPRSLIRSLQDPLSEGVMIIKSTSPKKDEALFWSLP